MRMKLIVGVVFVILALIGIVISVMAWNEYSAAKDKHRKNSDLLEDTENPPSEEEATILKEARNEAWDEMDQNEGSASIGMVVAIILAVLGAILIVVDVMKVKIPGEQEEETGSEEQKEDAEEE